MNWLQHFLDQSVHQNLCTDPGCTTCGAQKFRDGLCAELDSHLNKSTSVKTHADTFTDEDAFTEIARMLANVRPPHQFGDDASKATCLWLENLPLDDRTDFRAHAKFEEAVRFILTVAWSRLGDDAADRIVTPLLGDCWAGDLLARMKLHHEKYLQSQREQKEKENPERVKERREAKRQLKQIRHAERLERKRVRDKNRDL